MRTATLKAGSITDADRKLARRLLLDFIIFIVLSVPIAICEFVIEPFRRGFFCDDDTIRYPFRDNTVTPVLLGLLVGLLPLLIFIIVEFVAFYRRGRIGENMTHFGWKMPTWMLECCRHFAYFAVGLTLTFDATELGKYTIGRLRPHFMAVCQPRLLDGSSCRDAHNQHRYIENYICLGNGYTALDVRQARLSFPSGHSSLIFFVMVYMVIYMQHKITWSGSKLARYSLQFLLLMLAWFTALSRIIDNWHHWSDVLCGSLLGVACALITACYITRQFGMPPEPASGGLTRQDTTTTLDGIIANTPPPYALSGPHSFSNEQYCTKV